ESGVSVHRLTHQARRGQRERERAPRHEEIRTVPSHFAGDREPDENDDEHAETYTKNVHEFSGIGMRPHRGLLRREKTSAPVHAQRSVTTDGFDRPVHDYGGLLRRPPARESRYQPVRLRWRIRVVVPGTHAVRDEQ